MTQRTTQQNRALWKFFSLLSDEMNEKGLDMRTTLKESIEIWWTPEMVKEYLWKPFMKAKYGKESTTEMEKIDEIDKIHEDLMRNLGEKFGIEFIDWPSYETDPDKAPLASDTTLRSEMEEKGREGDSRH